MNRDWRKRLPKQRTQWPLNVPMRGLTYSEALLAIESGPRSIPSSWPGNKKRRLNLSAFIRRNNAEAGPLAACIRLLTRRGAAGRTAAALETKQRRLAPDTAIHHYSVAVLSRATREGSAFAPVHLSRRTFHREAGPVIKKPRSISSMGASLRFGCARLRCAPTAVDAAEGSTGVAERA